MYPNVGGVPEEERHPNRAAGLHAPQQDTANTSQGEESARGRGQHLPAGGGGVRTPAWGTEDPSTGAQRPPQ